MRPDLAGVLPELVLAATILLVAMFDLALRARSGRPATLLIISAVGLVAAAASISVVPAGASIFGGMIATDGFALYFKGLVLLVALLGAVLGAMSPEVKKGQFGEYLVLLLCLTMGMGLLAASQNLLMIYISLELVSLPSYVLAGFRRGDRRSSEAALKYVIFGAASSGLMLYGFSLLYGLGGTLQLPGLGHAIVGRAVGGSPAEQLTVAVALLLSLVGFGYKVAAVPFHMWCPDVYEGAPTPFVAFLSVGPKAAGMAALLRFILMGFGTPVLGLRVAGQFPWPYILGILSIATMTLGNLAAIPQDNVKRLLAYSSIAHAGYMLMGVAVGSPQAMRAVMLYLPIYLFMNLGAFLSVMAVRERTGSESISAYRGLGATSPALAVALAIFLFSLTGIPPFAGFIGKFFLFAAVLQARTPFFYTLAVIGVLNSVISLYYYARIVRTCFLEQPLRAGTRLTLNGSSTAMLAVFAVPTLVLGVWWGPLMGIIERSAAMLR